MEFQTVTASDSLMIHGRGPIDGRRHEWDLYVHNKVEEQMWDVLLVNEDQYHIHANSGYNRRDEVYVPFQGSNLTTMQCLAITVAPAYALRSVF